MLNYLLTIQRKSINAWQSSSQWFTNAFFFDWYEDNSFFWRTDIRVFHYSRDKNKREPRCLSEVPLSV
jgi:hypothetical protein